MKYVFDLIGSNPMVVYLFGMSLAVILAGIFSLSIWYYLKAKDLAPRLRTIKVLEAEIKRLKTEYNSHESKLAWAEGTMRQGQEAEKWLNDHREIIENLQKDIIRLREELEPLRIEHERLSSLISEKQQELKDKEKGIIDAEQKIENLRKEYGELTGTVPKLKSERDGIVKDIADARMEKANLEKNLGNLNDKVSEAKGELERLNGEIAAKNKDLANLKNELEQTKKDLNEGKKDLVDLNEKALAAEKKLAKWNAIHEDPDNSRKWKNLDTAVVDEAALRKADETVDEKKWLDDFTKSLEPHGFVFDERAIRAFHTGLKCATHTPLVVLAGISGTGKSLLPELYSAALGANFLSVPVQPRWDSPQDLFGFYNYMEGRYKATELARLLWQFDIYNNPAAEEKWKKGGLPLNLVLLDEMNIARVEYYFSDLLSKLETRNGINAGKSDERRKAEIELECNAADDAKAMRRLFVSPHTLFVGTMNEDESTQMLSDKVIDRSNVLRFGRPGILAKTTGGTQREPDKSGFVDEWGNTKKRLSADVWDKWCVSLTNATDAREDMRFLRDTLLPIGEALDGAGRAYGFRVDQAMKLYVLNYPGNYREAVSDQIEMKILPKLNGMELQNPHFTAVKQALSDAIAKTSDTKLQSAFDEACRQDTGATFFKWRGVMR